MDAERVVSAESFLAEAVRADDEGTVVAIVGPTASGKTALAIELAERTNGEIVSVDSVQVYKRFDLGSGKPSVDELARAPHHLVDVAEPGEAIDAARYASLADAALADIARRGRRAIVCGGTFLWAKALLYGLAEAPRGDALVRERHHAVVEREGALALHARLSAVDPVSASRLHPNDVVRVSRALEVFELTGNPLSRLQDEHGFRQKKHAVRLVARRVDPVELTRRITARAARWLETGWVDEVSALIADGFGEARAMGSVGYREVRAHLAGDLPRDELLGAIVRATRVFARRQRTWLNHADVTWIV